MECVCVCGGGGSGGGAERERAGESCQGGESRDLRRLFYTCIRTDRVRKLFIIFLILH